jgi:hypothetical protein
VPILAYPKDRSSTSGAVNFDFQVERSPELVEQLRLVADRFTRAVE